MTDLDKQALARFVAERIGYTIKKTCELWYIFKPGVEPYPENMSSVHEGSRYELSDLMDAHFPLFAHSAAGALAREESEEWLFRQGWHCWRAEHHSYEGNNYRVSYARRTNAHGPGATLAEARATAICNAVRGMREEGGKNDTE